MNRKINPSERDAKKSAGTIMAEEIRAKTNHLGDAERDRLVQKARELIYGAGNEKARASRG